MTSHYGLSLTSGEKKVYTNAGCFWPFTYHDKQTPLMMTLTEEQVRRMEANRKRALEIQQQRKEKMLLSSSSSNDEVALVVEREKAEVAMTNANDGRNYNIRSTSSVFDDGGFICSSANSCSGNIYSSVLPSIEKGMELQSNKRARLSNVSDINDTETNKSKQQQTRVGSSVKDENVDNEDDTVSLEEFELSASPYISQTEAQRLYCVPLGTLAVCSCIEKPNPRSKSFTPMKLYNRSEVRQRAHARYGGKVGLIAERERRKKNRSDKDLDEMKNIFG